MDQRTWTGVAHCEEERSYQEDEGNWGGQHPGHHPHHQGFYQGNVDPSNGEDARVPRPPHHYPEGVSSIYNTASVYNRPEMTHTGVPNHTHPAYDTGLHSHAQHYHMAGHNHPGSGTEMDHWHMHMMNQGDPSAFFMGLGPAGRDGSSKRKRRRVITTEQRRAANIRERRRMYQLNQSFDILRKRVPTFAYEKKLSRIETLKLAVTYIEFMSDLLKNNGEKCKDFLSEGKSSAGQDVGEDEEAAGTEVGDDDREDVVEDTGDEDGELLEDELMDSGTEDKDSLVTGDSTE